MVGYGKQDFVSMGGKEPLTDEVKSKFRIIIGYDKPSKYFIGENEVSKVDFAKEVMKRNER